MIIDCAHYQDGRRTDEKGVPLEEVAARRSEGGALNSNLKSVTPAVATSTASCCRPICAEPTK